MCFSTFTTKLQPINGQFFLLWNLPDLATALRIIYAQILPFFFPPFCLIFRNLTISKPYWVHCIFDWRKIHQPCLCRLFVNAHLTILRFFTQMGIMFIAANICITIMMSDKLFFQWYFILSRSRCNSEQILSMYPSQM